MALDRNAENRAAARGGFVHTAHARVKCQWATFSGKFRSVKHAVDCRVSTMTSAKFSISVGRG